MKLGQKAWTSVKTRNTPPCWGLDSAAAKQRVLEIVGGGPRNSGKGDDWDEELGMAAAKHRKGLFVCLQNTGPMPA